MKDVICNIPSEFSIILAAGPSIMATAELVVPVNVRMRLYAHWIGGDKHTQINTDDRPLNLLVI